MQRRFELDWGGRQYHLMLDPNQCAGWEEPLTMVYWVVGSSGRRTGDPRLFGEARRTDCITHWGKDGVWKGIVAGVQFTIRDSLFNTEPQVPQKELKKIGDLAMAQGIEVARREFQEQQAQLAQQAPQAMQQNRWAQYQMMPGGGLNIVYPEPPIPIEEVHGGGAGGGRLNND